MNTYISMLRGINVSGQKKIRMAQLRSLYEALGLVEVRSYLQSGNVVFNSPDPDGRKLARLIEAEIEQVFGYSVPVFMRTPGDFRRVVAANPFLNQRSEDPASFYITFLYDPPAQTHLSRLESPKNSAGEFIVGEKEIFLFCPNGYGRTKLSNNFFEKKLNVPATTRNWKTVNALHKMVNG